MVIKTKKRANSIYVYVDDKKVWTERIDKPHKSYGATKYRKHAKKHKSRRYNAFQRYKPNLL